MRAPKPQKVVMPPAPEPPPPPPTPPRPADPVAAVTPPVTPGANSSTAAVSPTGRRPGLRGVGSLISTGPRGLKSRARTAKRSLIGGS